MANPPIILCPYDAELFGHWWYEGPNWLYILFKKIYYDKCSYKLITPGEYIDKYPLMQVSTPCRSKMCIRDRLYTLFYIIVKLKIKIV